jgi:drug/metabolite transporter (DMT)-like permease
MFASGTILFVVSIRLTVVANTLVIISSAPLLAAVFSRFFLREPIPLRTWIATLVSIAAIVTIFAGNVGGGTFSGDLCAVGTTCMLAGNLVIIRRARPVSMVPALALSGFLVAAAVSPFASPLSLTARDGGLLLLLGGFILPVSIGLITVGPRYLPAPEVGLFLLLETVLGPLWVWLVLNEIPSVATVTGGAAVLTTLAVHSALALRQKP